LFLYYIVLLIGKIQKEGHIFKHVR